jgi:adenosylcobinamide kinase/adenosylcobinamide-phosphate guanylyltransferase
VRKIVFILGGARSGKSTFALREASLAEGDKVFIATAEALDAEMQLRIDNHKKERRKGWSTLEEPLYISRLIQDIKNSYDVVLIDCLTLWVSNIMHAGSDIYETVDLFIDAISQDCPTLLYIVSNEVGMGLVPENKLARTYRDNLGYVNRKVAEAATDVYFMAAGIPLKIKGVVEDDKTAY